jgi:hypothetical protein
MLLSIAFFALSGKQFRAQYGQVILASLSDIIFKQRELYFLGSMVNIPEAFHEQ